MEASDTFEQFLEEKVLTSIYPSPDTEIIKTPCTRPTDDQSLQNAETMQLSAEPVREIKENVVNAVDGRKKVEAPAKWPYCVHGVIAMIFKNKRKWGTGVLIGPNVVLTAGHNLYDHSLQAFADLASMQFIPGMNGQNIPFGDIEVEQYFISPNYLKDEKREDYGILILKKPIGEKTGYFGLACLEPEELKSKRINVTGYPADKVPPNEKIFDMWGMEGEANHIEEVEGHIKYLIDTGAGQSGSGVWYKEGEDYYVCGIHMAGTAYKVVNKATLLTREIYEQIHEWLHQEKFRELFFKLEKTKKLRFLDREINKENVSRLMKYNLSGLTCLDFSLRGIGTEGAKILAKNISWSSLSELYLSSNNIGVEGIKELAQNISWLYLSKLDLHDNNLGVEGAKELAKNKSWKKLSVLSLSSNDIRAEGCQALAKNIYWVNLSQLCLDENNIGEQGAKELAANKSWKNLSKINLRYNNIGDQGARELAKNTSWIKLSELDLYSNRLSGEGANALVDNSSWVNLSVLCLEENNIAQNEVNVLRQKRDWKRLSV